jgi:ABC-type molybdenum transport system ATPase subunit/photorepair protein PhrA
MATRFILQQDLLLLDETMDIIHTKQQFLKLLSVFPFKHFIIITHRMEFTE